MVEEDRVRPLEECKSSVSDGHQRLLPQRFETREELTPDKVLSQIGARNPYIIFIFVSMNALWGVCAMPMMIGSFAIGEGCAAENITACQFTGNTIALEFNLTGSRSYLADFTASAFILGNMLGSCVIPRLSDLYGRRPVLLCAMAYFGIMGTACAFAPNIATLLFTSFVQGTATPGLVLINWALCYESAPPNLRVYSTLMSGVMWVIGYVAVAPLAYFLQDWRKLYAATALPSVICAVGYYFIVPESFHYLVSKRKREEVRKWIQKAKTWNRWGPPVCVDIDALMEHANRVHAANNGDGICKNKLFKELLSNRLLLLYTAVMTYLWACDGFVYYGVSLFTTRLAGNRYINYVLSGLVELPCYLTIPIMMNTFGRRNFICLTHFLTSLSLAITLFSGPGTTLTLCAWLMGKFAIAWAFTGSFAYASEVFPTIYRTGCIGICDVFSRFCTIFAPTLRTVGTIFPSLPMTLISVMAGLATILALLLPETKDTELPDATNEMIKRKPKQSTNAS